MITIVLHLVYALCLAGLVGAETIVQCDTTKGPFDIVLKPEWSPNGVERFMDLVENKYFNDNVPLFRCVKDFLCQFGYLPNKRSLEVTFEDDPLVPESVPFKRGYISYAGNGPNSRSSHLFVTLGDDVESLGTEPWETPIGYVTEESMKNVVSKWNTEYGDMAPWGTGPDPNKIEEEGQKYLDANFPDLDYIKSCSVSKRDEVININRPENDDHEQSDEYDDEYDDETYADEEADDEEGDEEDEYYYEEEHEEL